MEKLNYLKFFLTAEASRAIKGLAITTENYEEALQVLDKRYGNVQVIVNGHFEELTKLPVVHNNDDTAKLRELYDKIETNLRSLRAIGIQADTYGCILVPMLKNKLPKEISLLLSRKFDPNKGLWEIEEIMRELRIELEAQNEKNSSKDSKIDGKNKNTSNMLTNSIKNREIILQSAVVLLKNLPTQKQIEAKMILYTGSPRSYITEKVRHHLNLKTIRTKEISISSFGEQLPELKKCDLVAFKISTKSTTDKVKVRALDVKRLCNRLKGHNINLHPLKHPKLHQLEFINNCEHDDNIEVGVLIGLDNYWDIVIGNPIRDTQNLEALETKLGYILSGPVYTEIHRNN